VAAKSGAASALAGPKAGEALKAAAPVLGKVGAAGALAAPFAQLAATVAADAATAVYARTQQDVFLLCLGLLLCLAGAQYVTLVAAYEAFTQCGGADAAAACAAVAKDAATILETAANEEAKDSKGKAPPALALKRKALLLARMSQPEALQAAVAKVWLTGLGVLAALKLRFARTMALSAAMAAQVGPLAARHLQPRLEAAAPAELRKWAPMALATALHAACYCAALLLAGALAAVHAALRGGSLAAKHGLALLAERGLLKPAAAAEARTLHAVGLGLAAVGLVLQAAAGFRLPFPFSLLVLPLTAAESTLRFSLGVGAVLA